MKSGNGEQFYNAVNEFTTQILILLYNHSTVPETNSNKKNALQI